ncbi:hypothetical protein SGM_1495 [Streptomyces griseoaurantiacus M045]|uniref:Uncharacterized protein n=1 Tax=Streptomyces griseoaurantiacus M045 TaxID=996637 RepID=F3NED1_9ACTN|nr:hypothetical protein SGM_1495 [Streptomyces griseoaurantiacus M045]
MHGQHRDAPGAAGETQAGRGGACCRSTPEPVDVLAHGGVPPCSGRTGACRARWWAWLALRPGPTPERSTPFPADGVLPIYYPGSLNRSSSLASALRRRPCSGGLPRALSSRLPSVSGYPADGRAHVGGSCPQARTASAAPA